MKRVKWTPEMDSLLGTMSDQDVADELGLRKMMVWRRRRRLDIPAFGSNAGIFWTPEMDALLGTMFDIDVADELHLCRGVVSQRRRELGIPPLDGRVAIDWVSEFDSWLGTVPDKVIADRLVVSITSVWSRRQMLGIPRYERWTPEMDALLGQMTDKEVGTVLNLNEITVGDRRRSLRIASWRSQIPRTSRYLRKHKLPDTLTYEQWQYACDYFENCCAYCGEDCFLTEDHLKPLSKGGPRTVFNIIPACQSCNSSKHDKHAHIWIYEKFGMTEGKEIVDDIVAYLTRVQEKISES